MQKFAALQIETEEGLENIEEIAAVPGVDALFVGPSDLSASLGHLGNPHHPNVREAIETALRRINKSGKAAGFLSANHDDVRWVLRNGCDFVAVGSDMSVLSSNCRALAADFKEFCSDL